MSSSGPGLAGAHRSGVVVAAGLAATAGLAAPPVPIAPVPGPTAEPPSVVQFGAFAELASARHLAQALRARGYPAEIDGARSRDGREVLHHARLAEVYGDRSDAASRAAALRCPVSKSRS